LLIDSHKEVRHANPIGPHQNAILILAIAVQEERVQLIERPHTPKDGELRRARKTTVALPPLLA
jgi:hypothetical protein